MKVSIIDPMPMTLNLTARSVETRSAAAWYWYRQVVILWNAHLTTSNHSSFYRVAERAAN